MRILFDHLIASRELYGGISRYIDQLAHHLAQLPQCDVSVIAPWHVSRTIGPGRGYEFHGHRLQIRKTLPIRDLFNSVALSGYAAINPPDILHQTYYGASCWIPKNMRRVVTVHDMIHEIFPQSFVSWRGKLERSRKAAAVRHADHIICVSENTRRDLLDILAPDASKVSVIPLGCNFPVSQSHSSPMGRPYLLYVGSRTPYKNFPRLAQAYASSPSLRLGHALVCFGGGAFSESEQIFFRSLKIQDKVVQVSGNDEVLGRYYQHASALVYPSLYEGFGIPPLEAMRNNCPVACAKSSSLPEVVGNAGEYFDPIDIPSIASAVERVIFNDSKRSELIVLGKKRASLFDWQACAAATFKAYQQLTFS